MKNRDNTPIGEICKNPFFYGPFKNFQKIENPAFASEDWIKHCKNKHKLINRKYTLKNTFKRKIKSFLGLSVNSIFSKDVLKIIKNCRCIVDLGGGWGDNFMDLKFQGATKNKEYYIVDNPKQAKFGKSIFKKNEIKFKSEIPNKKINFLMIIGTLQYIEDWVSFLISLRKKEIDYIYIYRTPFTEQKETFVSVQSIVPETLNYKIGEENLNIISMQEFLSLCNQLNWKVEFLEKRRDYSANFERLGVENQSIFYQKILIKS